ncbi:MAG: nitroreductase family deazaflavin-dependent oxidoreductase [Actinobacteria bacterium]|nr:nitroreductase family deazaflavin-dependent oxidoreductase [Actinomycetota bacterium]
MVYREALARLGQYEWFALTAAKLAPLDAAVLKRTGGRFGLLGNYGLPQCLLTTIGRKTSQPRTVTLIYGTAPTSNGGNSGEELILVGSNFGQSHHPAWALNLEANPAAEVTIEGTPRAMSARLVTDTEEREHLWAVMCAMWPAYNAYRGRAGREIKIFALT